MIKSWEELGEVLAEWENRLSCLENSLPFPKDEQVSQEGEQPEKPWSKRQWGVVQQLKAQVLHLSDKWHKHLKEDREYRAKHKKIQYKIYSGEEQR